MPPSPKRNERSKPIKWCPHHHPSVGGTPLLSPFRRDQPSYRGQERIQTDLRRSEVEMGKQVRQAQAALKQDYKTRKEALDKKLQESKAANERLRQELQKSLQATKGETGRKGQGSGNGRERNRKVSSTRNHSVTTYSEDSHGNRSLSNCRSSSTHTESAMKFRP